MRFRMVVPGERGRLRDLISAVDAVLVQNGMPRAVRDDVRLIAEEVVCNAMDYGCNGGDAQHEVAVDIAARDGRLHIEFRDTGCPFDPLSHSPPDLDADIAERPVGGLGVHLIRELAEEVSYVREDRQNVLRVVLRTLPSP